MKIALFGATGTIGQRILHEALARKHEVTAIVRDPNKLTIKDPKLRVRTGNILDPKSVAETIAGSDVVISAFGPGLGPGNDVQQPVAAAKSLLATLKSLPSPPRLIVVGEAGSLEVAPGSQLVDAPDFPAAWKPPAMAHRGALEIYRAADPGVNWT